MKHTIKIGTESYEIDLEASIRKGTAKSLRTYRIGDIFEVGESGDIMILARTSERSACLIAVNGSESGNRWTNSVVIGNLVTISADDLNKISGGDTCVYLGRDLSKVLKGETKKK